MTRCGYTYVRLPEPRGDDGLTIDPNRMGGEPCIRGTRIPVGAIAGYYDGTNMNHVCRAWGITEDQVRACIDYVNAPWPRPEAEASQKAGKYIGRIDELRADGPMTAEQVNDRIAAEKAARRRALSMTQSLYRKGRR